MKDYLDIGKNGQTTFKVSKNSKVEYLIKEKRFDEALDIVEDENLKGIILTELKRFDEAIECFDIALMKNSDEEIKVNKANALYDYAKVSYFPDLQYNKALNLINDALDMIPDSEDPSEYYFLKAEILESTGNLAEAKINYALAYKEFEKADEIKTQMTYLKNTTDTLINITGSNFYEFTPQEGMIVDLKRNEDNEHDPDAIAVMFEDKIIGYVANSDYTLIDEVKSASTIKNTINENQKAEILFIYLDLYIIAKLL